MPIYEFKCRKCGNKFEMRLGFAFKKDSVVCPACGENNPDRVFSPFSCGAAGSTSGGSSSAPPSFG